LNEGAFPVSLPCHAKVIRYDRADAIGSIEIEGGHTVRFGASSCTDFQPEVGADCWLIEVNPAPPPLGGWRARVLNKSGRTETNLATQNLASMREESERLATRRQLSPRYRFVDSKKPSVFVRLAASFTKPSRTDRYERLQPIGEPPTVTASLTRISSWLAAHAKPFANSFGEPILDEQLRELERRFGRSLPGQTREYFSIHNGQQLDGKHNQLKSLFRLYEFLPLPFALSEWSRMNDLAKGTHLDIEAEGPVRAEFWNEAWLPLVLIGGSTHFHCIDFAPADGGRVGQIIEVADDSDRRTTVAPDLGSYLARYADGLEGGWALVQSDAVEFDGDFSLNVVTFT
jgi:cell wall assembly regulator SMI1